MHYLNKCKYLILQVLLSILFIFLDLDRSMSTVKVLMIYVEMTHICMRCIITTYLGKDEKRLVILYSIFTFISCGLNLQKLKYHKVCYGNRNLCHLIRSVIILMIT